MVAGALLKILLVEDELNFGEVVRLALAHAGFEVLTVEDPGEGWELAHRHAAASAAVVDLRLPGIHGGIHASASSRPTATILPSSSSRCGPMTSDFSISARVKWTPNCPSRISIRLRALDRLAPRTSD